MPPKILQFTERPDRDQFCLIEGRPIDYRETIEAGFATERNRHTWDMHAKKLPNVSDKEWYGFKTRNAYKEALELSEKGWPEGWERIQQIAEEMRPDIPAPVSIRRRKRWRDEGDGVDVQRMYSGHFDRMWQTSEREGRLGPRVISIVSIFGGNCGRSVEQLFNNGATAVALTDVLENAGYRVELAAAYAGDSNDGQVLNVVRLKEADEPMEPNALAAVLAHSGWFRTFGIAVLDGMQNQTIGIGHGMVTLLKPVYDRALRLGMIERPDILIDQGHKRRDILKRANEVIERLKHGMADLLD